MKNLTIIILAIAILLFSFILSNQFNEQRDLEKDPYRIALLE